MYMPQLAFLMESVSMGEWVVLLAVIMIVMGPKSLPDMARKLGRWTETFRRAAEEFKRQIMAMDQEPLPPEPEPHYPDYDYGSGEDHGMNPEASEPQAASTAATVPAEGLPQPAGAEHKEAEHQEAEAHPSEVLPDSAQYYGNEELVASMEKEKMK
jgi:sec-independent protein translocase protein TatB